MAARRTGRPASVRPRRRRATPGGPRRTVTTAWQAPAPGAGASDPEAGSGTSWPSTSVRTGARASVSAADRGGARGRRRPRAGPRRPGPVQGAAVWPRTPRWDEIVAALRHHQGPEVHQPRGSARRPAEDERRPRSSAINQAYQGAPRRRQRRGHRRRRGSALGAAGRAAAGSVSGGPSPPASWVDGQPVDEVVHAVAGCGPSPSRTSTSPRAGTSSMSGSHRSRLATGFLAVLPAPRLPPLVPAVAEAVHDVGGVATRSERALGWPAAASRPAVISMRWLVVWASAPTPRARPAPPTPTRRGRVPEQAPSVYTTVVPPVG